MLQPTRRRGALQRPKITTTVITGMAELLAVLPAAVVLTTQPRIEAVRYLQRLVDFCQSDEYQARRTELTGRTRACQARKVIEAATEVCA